MSTKQNSLSDSEYVDEQLSAYLDGELPDHEAADLEQRLQSDVSLQQRLEALKNNWTLLEQLSHKKASADFAASTVEMVAIRSSSTPGDGANVFFWQKLPHWLLISIAALLSAVVGYLVTVTLVENRNSFLLENLGFLEYLPEYQLVEDVDFMDHLNQIEYFSSRAEVAPDPGIVPDSMDGVDQKRLRINGMALGRKRRLLSNYIDFQQISTDEQKQLLSLHRDLLSSNNAEIFSKVLIIYARWYQQLDPLEQVELTLRSNTDKIEYISNLAINAPPSTRVFTGKDAVIVMQWLEDVASRNEAKILRSVKKNQRDEIAGLPRREKSRRLVLLLIKNSNRKKVLLSGSDERIRYDLMKKQLSPTFQQSLANQDSIDGQIRLLIESIHRGYRDQRYRQRSRGSL